MNDEEEGGRLENALFHDCENGGVPSFLPRGRVERFQIRGQTSRQRSQDGCSVLSQYGNIAPHISDDLPFTFIVPSYGTMATLDLSQLPSLIKDGLTAEEEALKRRKTCRFIEEAGRVLRLPRVSISTAMVFFHRFFAKHSFQEHDRFEVAMAAIVLAAKTEESPKRLNVVILECYQLKARGLQAGRISQQQVTSPSPPTSTSITTTTGTNLDPKGEEFEKLKERILLLERVILHTIGFELSIDHPYKFLVEQIKKLIQTRALKYIKTPEGISTQQQIMGKMMNELIQCSMSFANDSMHTSLCLQFSPQQIATACVYLGAQFSKVEPVSGDWPTLLGELDIEALASISIQVMDLIVDRKASESDTVNVIRAQLELLKSRDEPAAAQEQPHKRTRVS